MDYNIPFFLPSYPPLGFFSPQPLPHELKILTVTTSGDYRYGVFCGQLAIKKGMRFGPYTGRVVGLEEMSQNSLQSESLWEVSNLYPLIMSRFFNPLFIFAFTFIRSLLMAVCDTASMERQTKKTG